MQHARAHAKGSPGCRLASSPVDELGVVVYAPSMPGGCVAESEIATEDGRREPSVRTKKCPFAEGGGVVRVPFLAICE